MSTEAPTRAGRARKRRGRVFVVDLRDRHRGARRRGTRRGRRERRAGAAGDVGAGRSRLRRSRHPGPASSSPRRSRSTRSMPSQVTVTPETPFTVDTSGRSVGVRFGLPLYDDTEYTVAFDDVQGLGGGPPVDDHRDLPHPGGSRCSCCSAPRAATRSSAPTSAAKRPCRCSATTTSRTSGRPRATSSCRCAPTTRRSSSSPIWTAAPSGRCRSPATGTSRTCRARIAANSSATRSRMPISTRPADSRAHCSPRRSRRAKRMPSRPRSS